MAPLFSSRYGRQYGLVHQDVVEDLNVLVVGDSPILPYLLLNLAFCGVGTLQGGVYLAGTSARVEERHLAHQFVLRREDAGTGLVAAFRERLKKYVPLFDVQQWPAGGEANLIPDVTVHLQDAGGPPAELVDPGRCRLFSHLTEAGIYVGHEPVAVPARRGNVLTPSLASLAGAVLAQEVLRLSNAIRHYIVADQGLDVALRLRSKEVSKYLAAADKASTHHGIVARLRLGGESLDVRFVETTDRSDEAVFRVSLPSQTLLTRLILDSIEVVEEPLVKKGGLREAAHFSVFGAAEDQSDGGVSVPQRLDEVSAFVVGVGGLGTWVGGLLAATPAERCRLTLVDCDERVEEHNLNRQILYDQTDVGKPKVLAAHDALLEIRPDAEIHRYPVELTQEFIRYINARISLPYRDPFARPAGPEGPDNDFDAVSRLLGMLAADAVSSAVFVSCLDNMQSRWVLNCVAQLLGRTLVNGGVSGFMGTADFVDPQANDATLVTRYGEGIKTDSGKVQCGGAIPTLSIVTTNAVIASIEALYAVCALIGRPPAFNRFFFDGTERMLHQDSFKERGAPDPLGIEEVLEGYESA